MSRASKTSTRPAGMARCCALRRGRAAGKQKKNRTPARARALKDALSLSLESLIVATADRAAELVVSGWRQQPAGAGLLADIDSTSTRDGAASHEDFVASALADLGLEASNGTGGSRQDSAALVRATAGLSPL